MRQSFLKKKPSNFHLFVQAQHATTKLVLYGSQPRYTCPQKASLLDRKNLEENNNPVGTPRNPAFVKSTRG